MKILILGGDGFCGWPTSLHLSNIGYDITIVDNLSRRNIDTELGTNSLTPIHSIEQRIKAWKDISGKSIRFINFDIAESYKTLLDLLLGFKPDALVHLAEQRSAPYSMRSSKNKRYTVNNNVGVTHSILAAITESRLDIHLVHLGSIGAYGYQTAGMKIPEGYLPVTVTTPDGEIIQQEILYPTNPGSIYHMTKVQDQILFDYYNKNDGIRVTDLYQGIVWGTQTTETFLDERLINRFDYDGDYGTVLNRFLMQASINYPLTVHGSGGQTRAFIHIQDTVRCIELAIKNPPAQGNKVKIINQITETYRIQELAKIISSMTGSEINHIKNPRHEADENEFIVENNFLLNLGLIPTTLQQGLMHEIMEVVKKYSYRCDKNKIPAPRQSVSALAENNCFERAD